MSLEEIDESVYNLAIPESREDNVKEKSGTSHKAKTRKRVDTIGAECDDVGIEVDKVLEQGSVKEKKNKKKRRKTKQVQTQPKDGDVEIEADKEMEEGYVNQKKKRKLKQVQTQGGFKVFAQNGIRLMLLFFNFFVGIFVCLIYKSGMLSV